MLMQLTLAGATRYRAYARAGAPFEGRGPYVAVSSRWH